MILVGEVLAAVSEHLDFSRQAGISTRGSIDAFYRHLNNSLRSIALEWPVIGESTTTTTTATSSTVVLPDSIAKRVLRIEDITFPSTWGTVEYITPQEMTEFRQKVLAGRATGTPRYWTYHVKESPYIELQPASGIGAEAITITYSYYMKLEGTGANYGKDTYIPIPLEYSEYLILMVAKKMCPKEETSTFQRLSFELNEERTRLYEFRSTTQHREVNHRPRMRF